MRVGEFLVDRGLLTPTQVDRILDHGKKRGLRFGESAIDLGILTKDQLYRVFGPSNETDFFALDPKFYPETTKGLFDVDTMLKFGMLPIGVGTEPGFLKTRKVLNLGILDPNRKDSLDFAEAKLKEIQAQADHSLRKALGSAQGIKVFLILTDQFLGILRSAHGVTEDTIRGKDAAVLDPTIVMYLDGIPGGAVNTG
jgi:hypothetical protein